MLKTTTVMSLLILPLLAASLYAQQPPGHPQGPPPIPPINRALYDAETTRLQDEIKNQANLPGSYAGLARLLLEQYKLTDAEKTIADGIKAFPDDSALLAAQGEFLLNKGLYEEAESALKKALEKNPKNLYARANLAQVLLLTGKFDGIIPLCEYFIDYYNGNEKLSAEDLLYIAQGCWILADRRGDKETFHKVAGGNDSILGESLKADKNFYPALSFWGICYLEKYNTPGAGGAFSDAVKINSAHPVSRLGLMIAMLEQSQGMAIDTVILSAVETVTAYPEFTDCYNLLALLYAGKEQTKEALDCTNKALNVNPKNIESLANLASIRLLLEKDRKSFDEICKKVEDSKLNKSLFYYYLGENFSRKLDFESAQGFYDTAIQADPKNMKAITELGINYMREGLEDKARVALEDSYNKDPFNVSVVNYLKLLDIFEKEYVSISTPHFNIRIHQYEKELMEPYVKDIAEETYKTLTAKYKFEPVNPILLEVFADHRDFSVRTMGLEGLGALGACLGKVVTIDSPYAREQLAQIGAVEFNWGVVFWHEFAHVIALQLSKFHVPRWFTEGLSTYEESFCRPGWDRDMELDLWMAYKAGKLSALTKLKESGDLTNLYYYGSLICECIDKHYGFDKIVEMLRLWGEGKNDEEVFKTVLGKSIAEFDVEMAAYMKNWADNIKYAPLRNPAEYNVKTLLNKIAQNKEDADAYGRLAIAYLQKGELSPAEQNAAKALEINPNELNAIVAMANSRFQNRDYNSAIKYFKKAVYELNYDYYQSHFPLAESYDKTGDSDNAIKEYLKAIECFPEFIKRNENPYDRLVKVYATQKNIDKVKEYLEKLVTLDQLDFDNRKKLAKIYIAQKDYNNAAKWLSQMIFIEPNDLVLHDMLANCYIAKKEFPKAETEYAVAIALCKKMLEMEEDETNLKAIATLYSSRAEMYLLQDDKIKAISDANEALMKVPDFPKALEILKKTKP